MGHVISRRLRAVQTPFIPAATTSKAQTCRRVNRVSVADGTEHHFSISPCREYDNANGKLQSSPEMACSDLHFDVALILLQSRRRIHSGDSLASR
jgi:hypothetical protein